MKKFISSFLLLFSLMAATPVDMQARLQSRKPVYCKINPISIPETIPSMQEIAATITAPIDAKQFLFGASTSEHQCSPHCTPEICSASKWADEQGFAQPTDSEYEMDLWTNYKNYIDDAKEQLGVRSIRFSIEMARVQPYGPGSWDESVLRHYADMFRYCLRKGITPLVCFHHYTDPNWFIAMGGFETIDNVDYFVQQCVKVYEYIMDAVANDTFALVGLQKMYPRVPLWITFNAAEAYAFRGYYAQSGPPSIPERSGLLAVANVIKNCCEATVRVSKALKESYASMTLPSVMGEPHVGFLKNIHQTDAARNTVGQKIVCGLTRWMLGFADVIRNDAIYSFFTTGVFKAKLPMGSVLHKNPEAVGCLDFVGLNYYSNRYMSLTSQVPVTDASLTTDGDYYHYPQGIYRAISELYERMIFPYEQCTGKKLMMYVAENGIATTDNTKRARFYHEYLYAIARAVQDGYPVYGYTPWALFDNYEWPSKNANQKRNYGICSVITNGTHLALKEGAIPLQEFGQALA
jgi:beta-glucosidase